jgi:hypothetical protein
VVEVNAFLSAVSKAFDWKFGVSDAAEGLIIDGVNDFEDVGLDFLFGHLVPEVAGHFLVNQIWLI